MPGRAISRPVRTARGIMRMFVPRGKAVEVELRARLVDRPGDELRHDHARVRPQDVERQHGQSRFAKAVGERARRVGFAPGAEEHISRADQVSLRHGANLHASQPRGIHTNVRWNIVDWLMVPLVSPASTMTKGVQRLPRHSGRSARASAQLG